MECGSSAASLSPALMRQGCVVKDQMQNSCERGYIDFAAEKGSKFCYHEVVLIPTPVLYSLVEKYDGRTGM